MSDSLPKRLTGLRVLITGASRGIGAAIAERFAREGADLILVARNIEGLEEVDAQVSRYGGQTILVPLDLMQHAKIPEMAAAIYERFKGLDVIIGNAAILGILAPTAHILPSVWEQVMAVNLTANWHLIRAFDPLLRQSKSGRAIFVTSSIVTKSSCPYWSAYAASKAALEQLVKTYASEVAHPYPNLKVNLICPGAVHTALREQAMPGENTILLKKPMDISDIFVNLAEAKCTHHGKIFICD
ncbi:MAG: SDR family NAD(P)-dependent oxidoreductase [Alphaproteobacteria bacterium]|nr:SDR family NAD(P)-dependent oxidoreductase [Alphaproteobacteria bacterium]